MINVKIRKCKNQKSQRELVAGRIRSIYLPNLGRYVDRQTDLQTAAAEKQMWLAFQCR